MASRVEIMAQVMAERERQIEKGFDAEKDDRKKPYQWCEDIASYNDWARLMMVMNKGGDQSKARNRYIQIAALAVAAVEAIDRAS